MQPVHLIEHGGVGRLERGDGAEQVPQGLEVSFHFAAAANDESLVFVQDAVHAAAGQGQLLKDRDAIAGHLPIANEEGRRGERGQARSHEIGGFAVHALGLAGAGECLKVAIAAVQNALLRWPNPLVLGGRFQPRCRIA